MTNPIDNAEEEVERRKKKGGDGDGAASDGGKKGVAGTISHLPPQKLKEVMAQWREIKDIKELVQAVAEFFSELPMRASANLSVAWEQTKDKSFAIVNWLIDYGAKATEEIAAKRDMHRGTGRAGKGTRNLTRKQQPKTPGVGPHLGPSGPAGPSGQ